MTEDYYVYAYLREDGTPYYIGKGKGDRAYSKRRTFKIPPKERIIIVLQNLTEEQAFSNEKDFIAWYGRKDNNTGILRNLTDGGEGVSGHIHSEETRKKQSELAMGRTFSTKTREKMSEAGKGRVPWNKDKIGIMVAWNKGKSGLQQHTEESKRKISEGNKGKQLSEETKQKMRGPRKNKVPWNKGKTGLQVSPYKGIPRSEETKRKISETSKGNRYITNGKENKVIRVNEELIIPEGWRLGMTKCNNVQKSVVTEL